MVVDARPIVARLRGVLAAGPVRDGTQGRGIVLRRELSDERVAGRGRGGADQESAEDFGGLPSGEVADYCRVGFAEGRDVATRGRSEG